MLSATIKLLVGLLVLPSRTFAAAGPHPAHALSTRQQQPLKDISASPYTSQDSVITPFDVEDLLSLHKSLVDTESVSGNEHAVGVFLTDYLRALNFTVEHHALPPLPSNPQDPHSKPRRNIYAYPSASVSGRHTRILLTSHIDTVPPFYGYTRYTDPRTGKDTLRGRGAVDAKAAVAAQITALTSLLASNAISPGDAALLFVVGEEVGGDGMRAASSTLGLTWESVIFGEPTELSLAAGHKGAMVFGISATGKAGHSGYPWTGENANVMLLPALVALQKMDADALLPRSAKYGNTTLNLGLLNGGVAANVLAPHAEARIQLRLAGGTPQEVRAYLHKCLTAIDPRLDLDFGFSEGYGPVDCDADIAGFGEPATMNYGTDVPHLQGDHKRYLYGPGSILVAHGADEVLTVDDLVESVAGYRRLVLGSLEKTGEKKGMEL